MQKKRAPRRTTGANDQKPVKFADVEKWEAWLREHADKSDGVTILIAKKGAGIRSVTHAEALDVALCHGWIDAIRRSYDERYFAQRFTPRTPKSIWSKINREKVASLIGAGRMQPRGLAEVERAKRDGRWDAAYDGQKAAGIPEDLHAALDASPKAKAFFAKLTSQNRYAILFRLQTAKKPETRTRRLETFVAMLKKGETIYPQ